MAMPAIEPATPLKELSREIVIGMSAPPTLTEMAIPQKPLKIAAAATLRPMGIPGTKARTIDNSIKMLAARVMVWWPRQTMGRPLITPASLPAAMVLPVKVRVPTQRAMTAVSNEKALSGRNIAAPPTRAEAAPPTPLSIPTIWGI